MNLSISETDLQKLPRPKRKEPAITPRILHFGPGAFFRSFVASLVENLNRKNVEKWGIIAVSVSSESTFNKLIGQDFVFNSLAISSSQKDVQQISTISDFLVASKDRQSILASLSNEQIEIVSLTITEKGYYYSFEKKQLDYSNQKIIEDLDNIENPKTAIGFIVAGLRERYLKGKKPFTVLSCDNLPKNGAIIKKVVLNFAQKIDPMFAKWILQNVCFPSSMVDRITPATKDLDIINFASEYGLYDPALVIHEEFFQWVIEDQFSSARPEFELAGIQLVANIDLYEKMKLRCLNGTHSAFAYLGYLAGFDTIAECMSNEHMVNLIFYLWEREILQTLETPEGENLRAYCDKLIERYKNPSIEHRTWQIAMDGSQKLPQRILETVAYLQKKGGSFKGLALAIAAWIKYVSGKDFQGKIIDVRDPKAKVFWDLARSAANDEQYVHSILDLSDVFPSNLSGNQLFREEVLNAYKNLISSGSLGAIKELLLFSE